MFEAQCLQMTDDPEEKLSIKANITTLQAERREQAQLLTKVSEATLKLMGPAPGSVIQQPPIHDPPQSTIPIDPLLLNSTPQPIEPCTPSKSTTLPTPDQPSTSTQPSSPFTPGLITYDFSALNTPTPMSSSRLQSKRAKPYPSAEAPAKRLKQAERHTITRSLSKNTLITQSGDDLPMDLFDDQTGNTVRPAHMTNSPFLFTALTDQGQCNLVSPRPVAEGSHDSSHTLEPLEHFDQRGRTPFAKSLSRKLFCYSYTPMLVPSFLMWIIFLLTLLCLVNSAAAIPAPACSLSLYALNTNGFVHPTKIDATNRAISHRNPDIVVITETKTNSQRSAKMSYNDYQFFEERGIPVVGYHLFKWGVILGIKKGITVSQRVPVTHSALIGRLIAANIVIPLDTGQGFTHRVIAARDCHG